MSDDRVGLILRGAINRMATNLEASAKLMTPARGRRVRPRSVAADPYPFGTVLELPSRSNPIRVLYLGKDRAVRLGGGMPEKAGKIENGGFGYWVPVEEESE